MRRRLRVQVAALATIAALGCGRSFTAPNVASQPLSASANPATVAPLGQATIHVSGGTGEVTVALESASRHSGPGAHVDRQDDGGFIYTAGDVGNVADTLTVRDALSSVAVPINVSAALSATPGFVSVGPGQQFPISVSGGSPPYCFAVARLSSSDCPAPPGESACGGGASCADGGGNCIDGQGRFRAQGCGPETDQVTVTDAVGATSTVTVSVTASLQVVPQDFHLFPGAQQLLIALGGVPPYTFRYARHGDLSDGSITTSGQYTAGVNDGVADLLEVEDAVGNRVTAVGHVDFPVVARTGGNVAYDLSVGDVNGDLLADAFLYGGGPVDRYPRELYTVLGVGGGAPRLQDSISLGAITAAQDFSDANEITSGDLEGQGRVDFVYSDVDIYTSSPLLKILRGRADGNVDEQVFPVTLQSSKPFIGGLATVALSPAAPRVVALMDGPYDSPQVDGPAQLLLYGFASASSSLTDAGVVTLPAFAPTRSTLIAREPGSDPQAYLFELKPQQAATGCTSGQFAFVPLELAGSDGGLLLATPSDGGAPFPLAEQPGPAVCVPAQALDPLRFDQVDFHSVDVADLDGDGRDDFVYAPMLRRDGQANEVRVLLSHFSSPVVASYPLSVTAHVQLGQGLRARPELDVTIQDGASAPGTPQRLVVAPDAGLVELPAHLPASTAAAALADFDGDHLPDAIVADERGTVTFLPGDFAGNFGTGGQRTLPGWALAAASADLDRDGVDDVLTLGPVDAVRWGTRFDGGALAVGPVFDGGLDLQFGIAVAGGAWSVNDEAGGVYLRRVDLTVDGGLAAHLPVPTSFTDAAATVLDLVRAGGTEDGGDLLFAFADGQREQVFVAQSQDGGVALQDVTAQLDGDGGRGLVAAAGGGQVAGPDGIWVVRDRGGTSSVELHPWLGALSYGPATSVTTLPFDAAFAATFAFGMPSHPGGPRDLLAIAEAPQGEVPIDCRGVLHLVDPSAPTAAQAFPMGCTKAGAYGVTLTASDLDGDGLTDALVFDGLGVFVLWQNPDGSFTRDDALYDATVTDSQQNAGAAAFGDFDGDGRTDIFFSFVDNTAAKATHTWLLLNRGGRVFY